MVVKEPPGLCDVTSGAPVPLQSVTIDVNIRNFTAQVEVEHRYHNSGDNPIEAIFRFPADPLSAVYHFEALVNGKRLVGEVHEQQEAQEMYSDAISSGKGAYLLEQETEDMFTMNVGNLPPKQGVVLKFSYVTELIIEGDDIIKFQLPYTVAPYPTKRVLKELKKKLTLVPYKLRLGVNVTMPFNIKNINCSTSEVKIQTKKNTATITTKDISLTKDFILRIELNEPHKPVFTKEILAEEVQAKNDKMAPITYALNFIPKLKYQEADCEVIFLLDRSGSMDGPSIVNLRLTMFQALKHLPSNVKLNIIGFGSSYKVDIATIQADMGGTELLPALRKLYSETVPNRQIFLVTDGGVSNKDKVKDLVQKNSSMARMFTFGIGDGVDKDLVASLAKAGRGEAIFINSFGVEMEDSIISQVHKALSPAFPQITISYIDSSGKAVNDQRIQQSPIRLPPIFNRQLYTVYLLVADAELDFSKIVLEASGNAGKYEFAVERKKIEQTEGLLLHRLAARTLIREISESGMNEKDKKSKITRLALDYNLASEYTSFLIVEDRTDVIEGTMEVQNVPTQKKKTQERPTSGSKSVGAKSVPSSYSTGGGSSSSSERRKRNQLEQYSGEQDYKKMKVSTEVISSPFGLAAPSPANLADKALTHVIYGPTLSMPGRTCWLDSLLGLLMTLRFNELELAGTATKLVNAVVELCKIWANASDLWWFRKELSDARRVAWEAYLYYFWDFKFYLIFKTFQERGFTFGHNHSVVTALQLLLKDMAHWQEKLMTLNTENSACAPLLEINNATQEFIVCLNAANGRLPAIHSKVINEYNSHYVCVSMADEGYFIYDNLLAIAPGGYQGGYVPRSADCYKINLLKLKAKVPLIVLKRLNQ